MSTIESLFKKSKCCITKDEHIVIDSVLVTECKNAACKQCIIDSKYQRIYCYGCKSYHEKIKLLNAPVIKYVENSIKISLHDLFEYVDEKLKDSFKCLNDDTLKSQLKEYVDKIENEIDLRYESVVDSLETYRSECKSKLLKLKINFEENIKQHHVTNTWSVDSKEQELLFQKALNENKHYFDEFKEVLPTTQFCKTKIDFFKDSLILDEKERLNLIRITNSKKCELIYRATVDGFTSKALHSECDDKKNLVSIIKNDLNHVFGGYTSVAWNIKSGWITDPKAFIFSLRRNGESQNDKFMIKNNGLNAFYGSAGFHLRYGNDINMVNLSNQNLGSSCLFGAHYELPGGIKYGTINSRNFIAGNYSRWLTAEIEVYQITT